MTNAWTKGPWEYRPTEGQTVARVYDASGEKVAICIPEFYAPDRADEQAEANARLIAAAPDMAEALETLLVKFSNCARNAGNDEDAVAAATEQARAALAKARGTP